MFTSCDLCHIVVQVSFQNCSRLPMNMLSVTHLHTYIVRRIQVISFDFFDIKKVCVHELDSRNLGMPRVSACVTLHFA